MKRSFKHISAERDVDKYLRDVARIDAALASEIPRPLDLLLATVCTVVIEYVEGLTTRVIYDHLLKELGVRRPELIARGDVAVAGFTCFLRDAIFMFIESGFGAGFVRFTLAHETGHVWRQFLEPLGRAGQTQLFAETAPPPLSVLDTAGHIFMGDDPVKLVGGAQREALLRLKASRDAFFQEVQMNAIAAELIAPYRRIGSVIAPVADERDRIVAVAEHFGLSREASRIRLEELGYMAKGRGGELRF